MATTNIRLNPVYAAALCRREAAPVTGTRRQIVPGEAPDRSATEGPERPDIAGGILRQSGQPQLSRRARMKGMIQHRRGKRRTLPKASREEGEGYARMMATQSEMVVCPACGRVIVSAVLEEPHAPMCRLATVRPERLTWLRGVWARATEASDD